VDAAVPGISALAAPVFDAAGTMALCLTAIGPNASFDARTDGALAGALSVHAQVLSAQLGAATKEDARGARR
jgi:DNA-binding IclR family transcriptional regulator